MKIKINYHETNLLVHLVYGEHSESDIITIIDNHFKDIVEECKDTDTSPYDVAGDINGLEEYGIALTSNEYEKARQSFDWSVFDNNEEYEL